MVREALREHQLDAELVVNQDGDQMLRLIERIDAGELPCPDLVLLDLNLPRRNGLELLARMRESHACRNVPVVIVTSSDAARDRDAVARLGATAYFRKPSSYEGFLQLGHLIKAVLGIGEREQ